MNLLKIRIIQIAPLLFWGVNVVGQSIDKQEGKSDCTQL